MEKANLKAPLVSICMPAYNAEDYIFETVQSILQQTYKNFELIIVNDGSQDDTASILSKIKDTRISIISSQNRGQCAAANLAYKYSKGAFIKFMDADDLLSANFLEYQVKCLDQDANKIASSEWGRFYNNDLTTFRLNREAVWKNMKPIDWLVESLASGHNMMQCGLWLIPRKILEKSGLWDERLSLINDFDFFIRVLLQAEEIIFTKNAVLYYRSGLSNSLSVQENRKAFESACLSTQLGCRTLLKFENSERTKKVCANSYKYWVYKCFPTCLDLSEKMEAESKVLGSATLQFPSGGLTKVLINLIGWKLTKSLKIQLKKLKA